MPNNGVLRRDSNDAGRVLYAAIRDVSPPPLPPDDDDDESGDFVVGATHRDAPDNGVFAPRPAEGGAAVHARGADPAAEPLYELALGDVAEESPCDLAELADDDAAATHGGHADRRVPGQTYSVPARRAQGRRPRFPLPTDATAAEERMPACFKNVPVVPSKMSARLGLPQAVTVVLDDSGISISATPGGRVLFSERYLRVKRVASGGGLCSLEFGSLSPAAGVLHLAAGEGLMRGTSNPPRLGLNERIRDAARLVSRLPDAAAHFAEVAVVGTPLSAALALPAVVAVTLAPRSMRVAGARASYTFPYEHVKRYGVAGEGNLVSVQLGEAAAHPGVLHLAPVARVGEFAALWAKRMRQAADPAALPRRYRFGAEGKLCGRLLDDTDTANNNGLGDNDDNGGGDDDDRQHRDRKRPAAAQGTPGGVEGGNARKHVVHWDGVSVIESRLSRRLGLSPTVSVRLDDAGLTVGDDRAALRQPLRAVRRYGLSSDGSLCSVEVQAGAKGGVGLLHLGFARGGAEFHALLSGSLERGARAVESG